jgi:hypothetical protein
VTKLEDYRQWLIQVLPQHERLAAGVKSLLEGMLKKKGVEYLNVNGRVGAFGIRTIGDLEKLVTKDFIKDHKAEFKKSTTANGILRRLMAYDDLDRYLATRPSFRLMIKPTFNMLSKKYTPDHVRGALRRANISANAPDDD